MEAGKRGEVGSIKIGKTNLNQLWREFDRSPYPHERIYSIAKLVGCAPECPCKKYERNVHEPREDALRNYHYSECGFYHVDDSDWFYGDLEGKTKICSVILRCRLVDLMKDLDSAYEKGPKIPLKKEALR